MLDASSYTCHAVLKTIGQALQAIAYSFGACGVVDRLPNTTTGCTDDPANSARETADCSSELGGMSVFGIYFFWCLCYLAYSPRD